MSGPESLWRVRLGSAFRTVLACTIVGCTILYGPEPVQRFLKYPAFSYVTTVLIVSDATLGDALRGCCQVLCASIQVMFPSILCLWWIGPAKFSREVAAMAVALFSFAIAFPDSTHLTTKRIAFGQTVIVYVGAVIQGAETGVIMHPVHVVSSTALAALASVLAMLFPYPHLAYREVRKAWKCYTENASKRINLLLKAFCAQHNMEAHSFITETRSLSTAGAKLLQSIQDKHEGMFWEKPWFRFLKTKCSDPREKSQEMEMPMQGMEMALTTCTSFPVKMMDEELHHNLQISNKQIAVRLEQAKCSFSFNAETAPERKGEYAYKSFSTKEATSAISEDLSPFFFLYCMELLQDSPNCTFKNKKEAEIQEPNQGKKQAKSGVKLICSSLQSFRKQLSTERMAFAIKCSLSLGLAVLFGLMYNKENGYWSGLTIAISFVTGRQATFTMSNARAQGTVMGSVYGILCCFIFQKLKEFRFLLLLPWIIFTSFLRHSRMYGQAGGISAIIGALLILGRKNYGTPSEFAIARITEAIIGLICFISVEMIMNPTRSSTLARTQLSKTLGALQDSLQVIGLCSGQNDVTSSISEAREKCRKLKSHVSELKNFIAEAGLGPNFWFPPFNSSCYNKLLKSITKMADSLPFVIHQIEFLSLSSKRLGIQWKEIQEQINNGVKHVADKVGSLVKCLDEVLSTKSLGKVENELRIKNVSNDLELGKASFGGVSTCLETGQNSIPEIVRPSLHQLMENANNNKGNVVEEKIKSQLVLYLYSLVFCINNLKTEAIEIEKEIQELLK